jgi:hypothetical protein
MSVMKILAFLFKVAVALFIGWLVISGVMIAVYIRLLSWLGVL